MRRAYFEFRDMIAMNDTGYFPYTPPTQLFHGLRSSLDRIFTEGLDNVIARHHRLAEGVRRGVHAWGMELCAARPVAMLQHRLRDPRARGGRCARRDPDRLCALQRLVRVGSGAAGGQGVPHRASGRSERRDVPDGALPSPKWRWSRRGRRSRWGPASLRRSGGIPRPRRNRNPCRSRPNKPDRTDR